MSYVQRVFRAARSSTSTTSNNVIRRFGSSTATSTSSSSAPTETATTIQAVHRIPATQVTQLPNGVRVASQRMNGASATVGLWVDTGSRYESEQNNGVAHFLEHMFFKGTTRRSQTQLEKEVENMGGHLNAYTSRETTVFYAKVQKGDVSQALDIISDMTQNSVISQDSVERERSVILREMEEVQNQAEEVVFDDLHTTAFQGTSLGRTILGPESNIRSLQSQDIQNYLKTHYVAPRMVVAGAGDIEHSELVKIAEKLFGNVPSSPPTGHKIVKEPALFTGSEIRARFDSMPLAHVTYAFQTAGWNDPDTYALLVMQTLLGSWNVNTAGGIHSASKFIAEVAQQKMAHSVSAFNTQYSDVGLFGIHAVAEEKALYELFATLPVYMTRLGYDVGYVEVEEAKRHLKMNLLAILDGTTSVCEEIGRQMISHGRRIHPAEVIARIDAVDLGAVKRAAHRFLIDRDFALAACGPVYELPDYVTLRRRTYKLI